MDQSNGSYERRREQVRKAQRTHRERKAAYVRSLEVQVRELRDENATLIAGSRAKQDLILQLQDALTSRGIPLPPGCTADDAQQNEDLLRVRIGGDAFPNQTLDVTYPSSESSASLTLTIDDPQVIVNFILALEQPCIYHHPVPDSEHRGFVMDPLAPTGHTDMLQSPIMAHTASFREDPFKVGFPEGTEWRTPADELERLLQTSEQLGLDGEITPVQIWHWIKRHHKFPLVVPKHLDHLRDRLYPLVDCHHFGAVIPQDQFEEIAEDLFKSL